MRRSRCVFPFLLLLGVFSAAPLTGQEGGEVPPSQEEERGFRLEQNYPNPFSPETRIPYVLYEDLFEDGAPVVVSVRIFNVLQQFVAAPVALGHPEGEGVPCIDLEYTFPGRYEAYWDGRDQHGNLVAEGIYFVQLTVNGKSVARKMWVTRSR